MEEPPWGEWSKGKPITSRGVARLLKPYGIQSRAVRLEDGRNRKGLQREQLEDAWKRHIPRNPRSYPSQRHNGSSKPETATSYPSQENPVTDRESPQTASQSQCDAVTDKRPVTRENGDSPTLETQGGGLPRLGLHPAPRRARHRRGRDRRDRLAESLVDAGEAEWVDADPEPDGHRQLTEAEYVELLHPAEVMSAHSRRLWRRSATDPSPRTA